MWKPSIVYEIMGNVLKLGHIQKTNQLEQKKEADRETERKEGRRERQTDRQKDRKREVTEREKWTKLKTYIGKNIQEENKKI